MSKNPNIYEGDKAKYVTITFQLQIPEILPEDQIEQFVTDVMNLIQKNFIPYKIGNRYKSILGRDLIKRGWKIVFGKK